MIRLCMLARDEEAYMELVAEACRGLYDSWLILVDDRTTDGTIEAAEQHLEGPGQALLFTFEDFSQARNALLDAARLITPASDYLLIADPDSPPTGVLPGLIHDWYSCTWRMGQTVWQMPCLIRAGLPCRYEGPAHELLIDLGPDGALADELFVDVHPKPFSVERAELYLDLLLPTAPVDPRSAFYLAQTYRDLGRRGEAIEAYLRCAQMPQPGEQAYLCILRAGELVSALDVDLARVLFERSHRMRPGRVESLYWLAWLANACNDPRAAAGYCAQAVQMPPSTDTLFVNRWAEHEGILEQLGRSLELLGAAEVSPTLPEDS